MRKKLNIPKGTELCECKGIGCKKCGGKGYRSVGEQSNDAKV